MAFITALPKFILSNQLPRNKFSKTKQLYFLTNFFQNFSRRILQIKAKTGGNLHNLQSFYYFQPEAQLIFNISLFPLQS